MKTVGKPYISSESILKGRFLTYRIRFTSGGSRSLKNNQVYIQIRIKKSKKSEIQKENNHTAALA